jgi:excisionase family DNA binding protein
VTEGAPSWLTLGAASGLLGVSESTIRRWADAGEIRSFRTSGGHRRVLEEDLRRLLTSGHGHTVSDSSHISDLALARAKRRLARKQRPAMPGAESLDTDAKDRLRLLGRQVVDLFARFIASGAAGRGGDRFAEDARMIGREYGRTLVSSNVRLTAAVATFNALRVTLEETAAQIATEAGLPADEAVEAIERVLRLADVVLEGMAEVYERVVIPAPTGSN